MASFSTEMAIFERVATSFSVPNPRDSKVLTKDTMKILYLMHSAMRGSQQWIAATWPI